LAIRDIAPVASRLLKGEPRPLRPPIKRSGSMRNAVGYVCAFVLAAMPIAAQENGQRGRIGLDFSVGSSSALGVTWHLSDRFALRPTFDLDFHHEEVTTSPRVSFVDPNTDTIQTQVTTQTKATTQTRVSAGLEALAYVTSSEPLSTYVSLSYQRVHDSGSGAEYGAPRSNGDRVGAGFGVQHAFSKRLSAYAEAQVWYSAFAQKGGDWRETLKNFGTTSTNIGAIFYLR
jgi:hypothetical protein